MSHITTACGRRVWYDELGSGSPVLLIPGHGASRRGCLIWLAEALAARYRVVAMDNRDAGESEPEPEYYRRADLAGDAAKLLDALGIDRAHVVGHSMGSAVALQLALDYSGRINRLVLISPAVGFEPEHRPGEPMPPPEAWWVDDPVERARRVVPRVVGPAYRARLSAADLDAIAGLEQGNRATWAGMMRQEAAIGGADLLASLPGIQAPTIVVHGEADPSVPLVQAETVAAGIPGAELVVLPGVGHRPWLELPEATIGAIVSFISATSETNPA